MHQTIVQMHQTTDNLAESKRSCIRMNRRLPATPFLVAALCLVAALFLTAGCLLDSSGLSGTSWVLAAYEDRDGQLTRAAVQATISFSDDGTLSGHAGCNSYSAEYREGRGAIVMSSPVATGLSCDDERVMEQEMRYLYLLTRVQSFEIEGDILTMYGPGDREILAFGRVT
ncbi:heat shock protein HslJ [Methanocalculus sp. AMF5]|nr:heat shock protein HslJ [Methanocalculus sp. AMF5]